MFDVLFVNEAGQVALGNLAAMAGAASNIVLIGDQMQLPQPAQGVHPGDTGLSCLEYLLKDHATVPDGRGILLNETHRLHPALCAFIYLRGDLRWASHGGPVDGGAASRAPSRCSRRATARRHVLHAGHARRLHAVVHCRGRSHRRPHRRAATADFDWNRKERPLTLGRHPTFRSPSASLILNSGERPAGTSSPATRCPLTAVVPEQDTAAIMVALAAKPGLEMTVDLERQSIQCGDRAHAFIIDAVRRTRLLDGWDDIALTEGDHDRIAAFAAENRRQRPWTVPRAGR
jgi:hypothetical protein